MEKDIASASAYLNNLLAARGLLKGGHKIPFDNLAEDETTPTRVINLVHDLVRRRDRDGEQKETLAIGMKALKESESKANSSAERYKSRCEELERRCATFQGQERVLNANVRSAEITAKTLKDETARLKTMVQQVRTQHANEIRKRDHQISRMKERLLEKSRGGRGNKQPISFPGVTLSGTSSTTHLGGSIGNEDSVPGGTDLALTDDTTAILTALSQNLADENDTLVSMIKSTVTTLKAISGMDTEVDQEAELEEGERNVITNDISYASLSNNVDEVLEHLKEMLNQPNYVPLEDLDARDREIERLGLQLRGTLEAWKNAIALVDLVNKQPDRTNSKKIRALEDVIERERRAVLEELDVNFQAIPPAETPPESTGNHAEGVDIWQLEVEEKLNQPTKKLTFQAEEVDEVDEAGEIEPTESQVYLNEKRIADAGEEEFLSGSQTSGGGEEGMEQTTARDGCTEASVDLVSFPIEDDSSMEVLSPTKPSIYTKKRQIVDATSPSLHLTKRTRFIDTSEKKKGRK
ncbi:hypothetical protein TWF225_011558 [Orbilia oligospora]|uniref:Uncharacterized protein n=1 Tax=Orbilia oligospora TaxID=2813651 RepID=A0A7C8P391_ORBOL|nr:hypothetical protein TWF751_011763 [Orbilia oligospora]KAF3192750.1 hypothetical protein TWF225_011558 [Orbilia oligospora]KAF3234629.1 hypothetical protein TWF128_002284 [Orbilia oligospora]KAF3262906.1 hypothetical protein TWF217_004187 [Orbilia oligospora]KAF3287128.1 hypothetical protein TWF132_008658 [Orbilia oligospora]